MYRHELLRSLKSQKSIEDLRRDSGLERPVLFVKLIVLNGTRDVLVPPLWHRLQLRINDVITVVSLDI